MSRRHLVGELATALLAGPWTAETLWERAQTRIGSSPAWLRRLVDRVAHAWPGEQPPPSQELTELLEGAKQTSSSAPECAFSLLQVSAWSAETPAVVMRSLMQAERAITKALNCRLVRCGRVEYLREWRQLRASHDESTPVLLMAWIDEAPPEPTWAAEVVGISREHRHGMLLRVGLTLLPDSEALAAAGDIPFDLFVRPPLSVDQLAELLPALRRHWRNVPPPSRWRGFSSRMSGRGASAPRWSLPAIGTFGELSEWLQVTPRQLEWLADLRGLERRGSRPRYRYRLLAKGSRKCRMIESPCALLRRVQRRILDGLLSRIPLHDAAHGFVPGRSLRTFVAPHVGRHIVVRLDLREFFPSVTRRRVSALFRLAGYSDEVSQLLSGLCTNATPDSAWNVRGVERELPPDGTRGIDLARLYAVRHLPQGAPTSPTLANLCAFRLDRRLAGLAARVGARYTRYADDLAFSGDEPLARGARRLLAKVAAIALEEGFAVQHHKTRLARRGNRQLLAGVVVNSHPTIPRDVYDRLRAELHNCVRRGPASQNRTGHQDYRAHLQGRVAYVEWLHPERGRRLRELWNQIEW